MQQGQKTLSDIRKGGNHVLPKIGTPGLCSHRRSRTEASQSDRRQHLCLLQSEAERPSAPRLPRRVRLPQPLLRRDLRRPPGRLRRRSRRDPPPLPRYTVEGRAVLLSRQACDDTSEHYNIKYFGRPTQTPDLGLIYL